MTTSFAVFWWLLALIGVFVLVFGLLWWVQLSRREDLGACRPNDEDDRPSPDGA